MKITTFLLPAAALVSTASAFLADCSCINGQPPFWNADIERLITEQVAPPYLYPSEYSIRALDRLYVQYHNVEVVVTTTRQAVKLTRPAFRDLLWELKDKRHQLSCDQGGRGIMCRRASRGTPEFSINMQYIKPPPQPTYTTPIYVPPPPTPAPGWR